MQVRRAAADDLDALCAFGEAHIPPHYTPLIGRDAALRQVRSWWTRDYLAGPTAAGRVFVAESAGEIVGVAQWGEWDGDAVLWRLYLHPDHRSQGVGPRLLKAVYADLPHGTETLLTEHFAANRRAAAFYEREGFRHLRTEPATDGDPAKGVVWRAKSLTGRSVRSLRPRGPGPADATGDA